jgi:hypothetical protein
MAGFTTTASDPIYKSSNINDLKNWHGGCKAWSIGADRRRRTSREATMTTTIQSARQFLCTSVAALVFATIAICTAVPVLPIA